MPATRQTSTRRGRNLRDGAVLAASQTAQLMNLPLATDVAQHIQGIFRTLRPGVLQAPRDNDASAQELAQQVGALVEVLEAAAEQMSALDATDAHEATVSYLLQLQELLDYLKCTHSELQTILNYGFTARYASQTRIHEGIMQRREALNNRLVMFAVSVGIFALANSPAAGKSGARLKPSYRRHKPQRRHLVGRGCAHLTQRGASFFFLPPLVLFVRGQSTPSPRL